MPWCENHECSSEVNCTIISFHKVLRTNEQKKWIIDFVCRKILTCGPGLYSSLFGYLHIYTVVIFLLFLWFFICFPSFNVQSFSSSLFNFITLTQNIQFMFLHNYVAFWIFHYFFTAMVTALGTLIKSMHQEVSSFLLFLEINKIKCPIKIKEDNSKQETESLSYCPLTYKSEGILFSVVN